MSEGQEGNVAASASGSPSSKTFVRLLTLEDLSFASPRPKEWIRELSLEELFNDAEKRGEMGNKTGTPPSSKASQMDADERRRELEAASLKFSGMEKTTTPSTQEETCLTSLTGPEKERKSSSLRDMLGSSAPAPENGFIFPEPAPQNEKLVISTHSSFTSIDTEDNPKPTPPTEDLPESSSDCGQDWPRTLSEPKSTENVKRTISATLRLSPLLNVHTSSFDSATMVSQRFSPLSMEPFVRKDSSSFATLLSRKQSSNLRVELGKSAFGLNIHRVSPPPSLGTSVLQETMFEYPTLSPPHSIGQIHFPQSDALHIGCFGGSPPRPPPKASPLLVDSNTPPKTVVLRAVTVVVDVRKGQWRKPLEIIQALLRKDGILFTVVQLSKERGGADLVASLGLDGQSSMIVVGGEEVFGEVVTGLSRRPGGLEAAPPLGFVGSGIDDGLLATLGISDARLAVQRILMGRVRKIDVCRCHVAGKPDPMIMVNSLSWETGRCILSPPRNSNGPTALRNFLDFVKNERGFVKAELDGTALEFDAKAILVQCAQHSRTGLLALPHAVMDDGMVDVMFVEGSSRTELLAISANLRRNGAHVFSPQVRCWRAHRVRLVPPNRGYFSIDGLALESTSEYVELEVLPRALRILS